MKTARLVVVASLLALVGLPAAAQTLDPTFTSLNAYAPGTVYAAVEQPDGKRIINGAFLRINGGSVASRLVRLNADGSLDNTFLQNVGAATAVQRMHLLSNGQVLLVGFGGSATTAGGVSRSGGLLRLNADGTGDASFDAGSGPTSQLYSVTYLDDAAVLPSGKVVAVGPFDHFNGAATNNIVGLNANGSLDTSFNPGTGANDEILTVVALPSGKLLIGGYFTSYNGFNCDGLARLNADGSFDTSFTATTNGGVENITVQPDGKILLAGQFYPTTSTTTTLIRLNANGTPDNTFAQPTQAYFPGSFYGDAMHVQADGKIVVIGGSGSSPYLTRLNPNGTIDATYQVGTGPNASPYSLTALASGGTLVAGNFSDFNGTPDRTLIQLSSAGAVDAAFQPKIQTNAGIYAAVRQADGKYVVGGTFTEINGQPARRLARINTDGSLDQQYGYNSGGLGTAVNDIVLQNGSAVVATGTQVLRFQSTGAIDNTFAPTAFSGPVSRLVLQPDGRLLAGGSFSFYSNRSVAGLVRLDGAGNYDASFAPVTTGANAISQFHNMALQPDGKLLVEAYARTTSTATSRVMRLLANGTVDASFTALTLTNPSGSNSSTYRTYALALQPDGKILLGGAFGAVGGTPRANLARLNADGTIDTGFTPAALTGTVFSLAVQPNNRLLVGGAFTSTAGLPANLARLNADGTADASFAATTVPNSSVRSLLVQTDGAVVIGGFFNALSGQSAHALARITAPNVLHAALPQAVADRTQAWPVPARTTLHVSLDPAARAQSLELLDILGRPVRRQALSAAPDATLSVEGLPAGQYLLRVHYAQGTVARRVSVQ
ncbi:T9SS type A sorting domain-containing protein [Hymenobacter sp. 15J16-1T3B]|uniref:T9SS type A sorting domain-containing protein n=1 Tax=Hymenobacter sp. 15J16-1T3B TaxID=2886941 RepID=UPI001D127359|nr:T9SS type A sorting domain-containing protein [Hymenobacter sp. 15J16-1T3B]MCC3158975.1 T9SS type A sorting domain-containing protein [Hymenobacter sp. 15J16-1T3B]